MQQFNKKTAILSFLVILIFASWANYLPLEASSITDYSEEERLQRSQAQVGTLAKYPEDHSVVLISFNDLFEKEFSQKIADRYELKIWQIYSAHKAPHSTFRGGYLVGEDGVITDQNLSDFESETLSMARVGLDALRQMVQEEALLVDRASDEELILPDDTVLVDSVSETRDSLSGTLRSLEDQEDFFNALNHSGVKLYGMWAEGLNEDLLNLSHDSNIKSIEIVNPKYDRKATPILP